MSGYNILDRLLIKMTKMHQNTMLRHTYVSHDHHLAMHDDATPQARHGTPPAMKRTCSKLEGGRLSPDHHKLGAISPVPVECKHLDFTSQNVMFRASTIVPVTRLTNKPSTMLDLQETSLVIPLISPWLMTP